ncbi:ParA family protein [Methylovirgula sp. 4M-Z18]|uniref:ParA family protein n=1 Tax=Methylovirgula sp. 4M-Z18 TaxID=2293567 RepID=UPI000E2E9CFE|nr:ParA family protein [Methylovirgula sp. 4M-Z18]RFB80432.1 ParA family protein [Methylovirgula sp. 4M-Z18]
MTPKIVTVFNNKGGVGKTTLTYHLAHALGELGKRVLLIDLDPQCNLTIVALEMEAIHEIWTAEDNFIEDFANARDETGAVGFSQMLEKPRSIHFTLKPAEDGTAEIETLPPPAILKDNVHIIPGRLTLHLFEAKIGERWSGIYQGDPLSIRTATRIRTLAHEYAKTHGYEIVILDTSPSLGALNRHLLSLADGFMIPCSPDLFSVYGIKNIGDALRTWRKQFESIFHFLSDQKRSNFPEKFVRFMGYTIYNAKRYSNYENNLNLAKAHHNYAKQIPETIANSIDKQNRLPLQGLLEHSIGDNAIIHSHNTFPSMSQKYHMPMWELPDCGILDPEDRSTIAGNQRRYRDTKGDYEKFATDFVGRLALL